MRKVHGTTAKFEAGTLREGPSASATVESKGETLHVVRPTMKQAVLAANRLMKKLGWTLAEPWERVQ